MRCRLRDQFRSVGQWFCLVESSWVTSMLVGGFFRFPDLGKILCTSLECSPCWVTRRASYDKVWQMSCNNAVEAWKNYASVQQKMQNICQEVLETRHAECCLSICTRTCWDHKHVKLQRGNKKQSFGGHRLTFALWLLVQASHWQRVSCCFGFVTIAGGAHLRPPTWSLTEVGVCSSGAFVCKRSMSNSWFERKLGQTPALAGTRSGPRSSVNLSE